MTTNTTDATEGTPTTSRGPVKRRCTYPVGFWHCIVHTEDFRDNAAMFHHTNKPGAHVLAWVCVKHGPEVP